MSGRKIISYYGPAGYPLTERTLELRNVASGARFYLIHIGNGLYDTGAELIPDGLYRLWDSTLMPIDTGVYVDVGSSNAKEGAINASDVNKAFFGNKEFRDITIADVASLQASLTANAAAHDAMADDIADLEDSKFDKSGGSVSGPVSVSGFVGLGSGSTPVKMKVLTGVTSNDVQGSTSVAHDLAPSKILSVNCLVYKNTIAFSQIPPNYASNGGFGYDVLVTNDHVVVTLLDDGASFITGLPFAVTILYKE